MEIENLNMKSKPDTEAVIIGSQTSKLKKKTCNLLGYYKILSVYHSIVLTSK